MAAAPTPHRRSLWPRGWRWSPGQQARLALVFLPPALLLFTLFVVLPMGEAAWYSLFEWNGFGPPAHFIGLDNYRALLANPVLATALTNNALIIAVSLLVQLPLAMAMAVLLAEKAPATTAFRLTMFLPYVLADVAAGLIWRFVYDGDHGLVSRIWQGLGFDAPYLLADPSTAMSAILAVVVWKYFGFHMILFIAGLQQIDRSLYQAAQVDGASPWQTFRLVTLPLLMPTVRLSVFFSVLGSLQLFDLVMPMTQGGPSDSTQTMVTYLYNFGVTRNEIGFGSAAGMVLFVICVVFAFGYQWLFMRHD